MTRSLMNRAGISAFLIPAAAAILIAAAGCGEPPQANALDKYTCPSDGGPCVLSPTPGVVSGAVVYQGTRRGDAVLLLFASNSLPPPDGTASAPVEIARVPSATLFAGAAAGSSGPFSAPYLFTQVPPGSYQIRAFLDLGGDFDPFADFTQSPHAGAPIGGTVSFDASGNAQLASFTVAANTQVTEQVILGQEVPFDPPAFQLAAGQASSFPQNIDRPQQLVLQTFNPGVPHATFANPKFTLQLHPNAAGAPQESDADGLLDIYPQVSLLQTTALQPDGSTLAVSGTDAAIVPCKVLPVSTWPLLIAQPAGQFGLDQITVLVDPLAVKLNSAGVATPLAAIPAGQYKLVVAERTGQVWTLPNSLGSQSSASGYFVASQATAISFSSIVAPGGAISGKVRYPAGRTPHNLILQAFLGGPSLAPPLSVQQPARVLSVPARFISLASDHTYSYTLAGLSPGSYVVEAIDDGDGNYNAVDILETPTRGDLVGGIFDSLGNLATVAVQSVPVIGQDVTLVAAPGQDGQGNGTALDPPAFVLDESAGPAQITQDARGTVRVEVQAQPDPFPALNQQAATTLFTVALVRDAAGNPVDTDGDGLPDVWPRAFLLEIDPTDPAGLALKSPAVALPAAVDPTPFLPALLAGGTSAVLPATRLSIIVRPTAVDLTNPAAPVRLGVMPAGKYKLILMNKTGQLWQLPNSSGTASLDPRAAALVNTASQSRAFAVLPPAQAVPGGEIDGTLTVNGIDAFHSGYVFAYSAAQPPPPLGTGKPVSVDFHAFAEFAGTGGVKTVAYALRGLPAGTYFVTAVIDARGDFAVDPFLFAAAPGPGDFIGRHVDATLALAPVSVVATAVPGISVAVASAQPLPARPSFELTHGTAPVTADISGLFTDALTPQRLTLTAQTELTNQVVALDPETAPAFFPLAYQACDSADPTRGADNDFDNLPDLYPRILVVKLADSDPSGLTIDPANIAIPAAIDPTPYLGALGACSSGTVLPVGSLSVILQPIAVQQNAATGALTQLPIPAGRYGVVLESKTGQVWRIPNELQPALLDPRSAATSAGAALATQGVGIRVAAQIPPARGGAITGSVTLIHQDAAEIGNLIIAAYFASSPPPPLGTGRPAAVQVIPRTAVAAAVASFTQVDYLLSNLQPGTYLLLALHDPLGEFSPSLDFMSTPPEGAQLAFAGGAAPAVLQVAASAVVAPTITLDGTSASEIIPFPRPSFSASATSLSISSSGATTAQPIVLTPYDPAGISYPVPNAPAFHPTLARDANGQPYRDTKSPACSSGGVLPWASSQVYATPIDTGSRYVAYVQVNSCQFCQALTGSADCSAAPLAVPQAMNGPITAAVTNLAIDPVTQGPADAALPQGHYALTLLEQTGQSWTVPNALASADATQGAVFTVLP